MQRARTTLLIIAALFFLPLALAWMMHIGALNYQPTSTRNLGRLVAPPVPIPWRDAQVGSSIAVSPVDEYSGHWVLLYPVPDPCEPNCLARAASLRQVRLAAGRNQGRIRVALLRPEPFSIDTAEQLLRIHPSFLLLSDPRGTIAQAIGASDARAGSRGEIYLTDPLGNIMMSYEPEVDPNNIKQDLKRLLTWSKLDEHQ